MNPYSLIDIKVLNIIAECDPTFLDEELFAEEKH